MFRRGSYAQVASGNAGNNQSNPGPARSGIFSHLANSGSNPHSIRHSRSVDVDGQHNSMPSSLGRSAPSYPSQPGPLSGYPGMQDGTVPDFFVPSYLRGSRHAEKLEEIHKQRFSAQREHWSAHSPVAPPLSASSSSVNLHKAPAAHRGLSHDIVERTPVAAEEPVAPWPTRWNDADKFPQMEVEDNGRQAKFGGAQKAHDEAASIRADYPMPRQCGIYYYEVTVVSKGKDGMIGVGFSGPKVALSRIPGWEPDSFAYHGDDGLCFSNTTSGKQYGPKFGTLDVIGCGINFRTNTAFFTKNGQHLGLAFRDLKPNMPYYPTIGMKKSNETLRANFGQEPFAYDIDKLVHDEKAAIQQEIAWARVPVNRLHDRMDDTQFIHRLIGQYLAHDGYVETARAFAEEVFDEAKALASSSNSDVPYLETEEDIDAVNRQRIRAAILEGDIDKALKHTNAYYPTVLQNNENIYFKLRCRKFIEMIRAYSDLHEQCHPIPTPPSKRSTTSTVNTTTASNPNRNSTATDEYDFEMELDEQLGVNNGAPWGAPHPHNPDSTSSSSTAANNNNNDNHLDQDADDDDDDDDEEDEDDIEARTHRLTQMENDMLTYGMELRQEFANDPRREVKRALEDTFALIAYVNPKESPLAPLLDTAGRAPVAEELNGAVLVSLGKSSSAALERLVQQTEALVAELADDGGAGAFINVRRDYLQ